MLTVIPGLRRSSRRCPAGTGEGRRCNEGHERHHERNSLGRDYTVTIDDISGYTNQPGAQRDDRSIFKRYPALRDFIAITGCCSTLLGEYALHPSLEVVMTMVGSVIGYLIVMPFLIWLEMVDLQQPQAQEEHV